MPTRAQALAILTRYPRGETDAVMITAHGFTREQIDELIEEGLAVPVDRRGAVWLQITAAGRKQLTGVKRPDRHAGHVKR